MDDEILDAGLSLALEFGTNWLMPIQERLAERYPELSPAQLDAYDKRCREVRDAAQKRVGELAAETKDLAVIAESWSTEIKTNYPWISASTLRHLYSQALYYLYKGGL